MGALHFLVPASISLLFIQVYGASFSTACVSTFLSPETRNHFNVCLKEDCHIIKDQNPIVFVDDSMKTLQDQRPFLCSNPRARHSELRGVFFHMIKQMEPLRNARCVWAGHNCTFDGILNFVNESARAGYGHRWIASGLIFHHPYRISEHTMPTSSIEDDELRILGPPIKAYASISDAWDTINKPFTIGSRLFLSGCVISGFVLRIAMAFFYTKTEEGTFNMNEFRNRFADFENNFRRDLERDEESWRRANLFWWRTVSIMVILVLILWEVAIAVSVFDTRLEAPFQRIDPEKFGILRNTGTEYLFRRLVEIEAKTNGKNANTGWKRYNHGRDVFHALLDPASSVDYTVEFELFIRWQLKIKPQLCETLRLYNEVPTNLVESRKPPSISGGWYFSSRVPISRQAEINQAITSLKEKGIIREIIDNHNGELADSCKLKNVSIGVVTLVLFIVAVLIPFVVIYIIVFWCIVVRTHAEVGGHEASDGIDLSNLSEDSSEGLRRRNTNAL